jgi:hypothetical protein
MENGSGLACCIKIQYPKPDLAFPGAHTEPLLMPIDIDKLTEAELIDLNNRVAARLKFLHQMRAHAHMLDFSIGERVSFQPEGHPVLTGIISKYNRKTVTVITENGQQWNVAPVFLRKAESSTGTPSPLAQVINLPGK